MFETRMAAMVDSLVDCLFRTDTKTSLYIRLECRAENHFQYIHFIIDRPKGTGYTKVFACVSPRVSEPPASNYKFYVNHDSCWRDDGINKVLTSVYFDLCKAAKPNLAPKDVETRAELVEVCFINTDIVSDPADTYRKVLKFYSF